MNIEKFLAHHGMSENPFGAEEARHDPVYERLLLQTNCQHPDFAKILGRVEHPSTSVVFGEKGSGKTAIRLMIGKCVADHNQEKTDGRTMMVAYDNLNPTLDLLTQRRRREMSSLKRNKATTQQLLEQIRLEDHQDAILSVATTRLIDALLDVRVDNESPMIMPEALPQRIKKMPRRNRVDLLTLAALYDQPRSGDVVSRWSRLRSKLRVGARWSTGMTRILAMLLTVLAAGIAGVHYLGNYIDFVKDALPAGMVAGAGVCAALAIVLWISWVSRHISLWRLSKRIWKQTPTIDRTPPQLREMLINLPGSDLAGQTWPSHEEQEASNSRYELTAKLLDALEYLGYVGIIVLIDRVDEPTLVAGNPDRMRAILWPMLDNKFLQQDRIGFKLLLPIELRHSLHRESSEFFQEARLDKQSLVDRLEWSGATLYDLCSNRLRACRKSTENPIFLTDIFEPNVSREMLVDALNQMHQPRDAFKFLYTVIQEHCRMVPDDEAKYMIPKVTLDSVRRDQALRVQELYRGLSPA